MKTLLRICMLFILTACVAACSDDDNSSSGGKTQTVIAYLAGDNNLSEYIPLVVAQLEQVYVDTGTKLVLFADGKDTEPYLIKIEQGTHTVLKSYEEFNSVDPERFRGVLNDAITLCPSSNYGLILWSHALSWLPVGADLRSFGDDNGEKMDIKELAEALPVRFDYILFDACLMGSVEVAYELKDKADYLIVSPAETLIYGYPYDKIIPELLKKDYNLEMVARTCFEHYNTAPEQYRASTVSLIKTSELEHLATIVRQLVRLKPSAIASVNRYSVQQYDTLEERYHVDFSEVITRAFGDLDLSGFRKQLNKAVLYADHTPDFLGLYEIKTCCGLSCYIRHPERADLNTYYKTLKWSIATGM